MKLDDNYSHTGAVNRALKIHYRGESYILKMDSDIEIDDREILHKMIPFLKNHPEAGIIGPKMKIPALNKNMVAIRWIKCLGTLIQKEQAEPIEADLVNGGFLLIQAELYKKLRYLWSEILFYGWTELDLCERARASGYKTFFYPHATVIHKLVTWRSRSEKRTYYDLRNLLLANWKYGSACSRTANFVVLFWPRIVYWLIVRSHFNIFPIIGAVKDFIILRKKYENE